MLRLIRFALKLWLKIVVCTNQTIRLFKAPRISNNRCFCSQMILMFCIEIKIITFNFSTTVVQITFVKPESEITYLKNNTQQKIVWVKTSNTIIYHVMIIFLFLIGYKWFDRGNGIKNSFVLYSKDRVYMHIVYIDFTCNNLSSFNLLYKYKKTSWHLQIFLHYCSPFLWARTISKFHVWVILF